MSMVGEGCGVCAIQLDTGNAEEACVTAAKRLRNAGSISAKHGLQGRGRRRMLPTTRVEGSPSNFEHHFFRDARRGAAVQS